MPSDPESRPPRGALAVVAVGLLATLAAALLSNPNASAGAAEIEWETHAALPDSKPAEISGGGGEIQLVDGGLRATGRNVSGYQLFRVTDVLAISKGAAVGNGRITCTIRVPARQTLVAHTPQNRASYPRPSEEDELVKQEVPDNVVIEFNAKGTDVALVEFGDAFDRFIDERGVTVSWTPFAIGRQGWQWGLSPGRPRKPLRLAFASIWRTTAKPTARVACTLTTSSGSTRVGAAGELAGTPQPIAE
ncbi:MAG: hypothetical protein ACHQCI_02020 [Solirubrobacterales bacterium]